MNPAVIRQTFRTSWTGFLWYAVGVAALIGAMAAVASSVSGMMARAMDLMKSYPKAMLDAFQINPNSFGTPVGYMSGEVLSLMWPLILVALVLGSATTIAGMVEDGTIHFEASLPVRRDTWLLSRWLTAVAWLAGFVALTILALYAFVAAGWWRFGLLAFAYGFMALGFSFAVAAFSSRRTPVTSAVYGVFLVQWLLTTLAASSKSDIVKALGNLSPWGAWRPEAVVTGGLDWTPIAAWLVLGLAFVALAAWRWRARDLPA